MPNLPLDLYRPIVECVNTPSDLSAILFVSRAFCHEAERCLYRSIVVPYIPRGDDEPVPPRLVKFESMLKELHLRPHITPYIEELNLWALIYGINIEEWNPFIAHIPSLLNLKTYHLPRAIQAHAFVPPPSPTSLFKLHTISFGEAFDIYRESEAFIRDLCSFIESQTEIRRMGRWSARDLVPSYLSMTSLPKLEVLCASIDTLLLLFPDIDNKDQRTNRPIQQLGLHPSFTNKDPETVKPFAKMPHLSILGFIGLTCRWLPLFRESFETIEKLKLTIYNFGDLNALKECILHMPRIRVLDLDAQDWDDEGGWLGEEVYRFAQKIKSRWAYLREEEFALDIDM